MPGFLYSIHNRELILQLLYFVLSLDIVYTLYMSKEKQTEKLFDDVPYSAEGTQLSIEDLRLILPHIGETSLADSVELVEIH